jgi:hypothetical protein
LNLTSFYYILIKESNKRTLAFACTMLSHRFPRVRKYAGEHLYVSLLENMELVQNDDESILDYLLNAPWQKDLSTTQCLEMANKVATVLGVTHLEEVSCGTMTSSSPRYKKTAATRKDDFASYASLLESSKDV